MNIVEKSESNFNLQVRCFKLKLEHVQVDVKYSAIRVF